MPAAGRKKKKSATAGARHTKLAPNPLDNTQLNLLIREVCAWMTVGLGITATVASALLAMPFAPGLELMLGIVSAHLIIAFALDRKLSRFSPTQAGAFFIIYAALTGFTLSSFFYGLFHPTVSYALVSACCIAASLFGLMALLGRRTQLDFSRARSYGLMALLGLLIAFFANKLLAAAPFDYLFSYFTVLYFSLLAACQRELLDTISSDTDLRIKPADGLRFSLLATLKLYLTACNIFLIALTARKTRINHNFANMQHHQRHHSRGFGSAISAGGVGGGMGSVGGGGGGSFSP